MPLVLLVSSSVWGMLRLALGGERGVSSFDGSAVGVGIVDPGRYPRSVLPLRVPGGLIGDPRGEYFD